MIYVFIIFALECDAVHEHVGGRGGGVILIRLIICISLKIEDIIYVLNCAELEFDVLIKYFLYLPK